jgi:UDP-GlcNAc3NAcA epimerase
VGARPQLVKVAVIDRAIRSRDGVVQEVVHTGQHYDAVLSQSFFDELDIAQAKINLGVGSDSHARQTGEMLSGLDTALNGLHPDWVIVYGDTNSTLAGALVASKLQIPVAHIEAGLRSFNRVMPEEINRLVTDVLSAMLFTPSSTAAQNLEREGVTAERIVFSGDVMLDAIKLWGRDRSDDSLAGTRLPKDDFVVATIHRAETTDRPDQLREVLQGLSEVANTLPVVLPLHPRTRAALKSLRWSMPRGVIALPPVSYRTMIQILRRAAVVATDSGGVQKEAFFVEVPCVTLRTETEWPELVELGWNVVQPPVSASDIAHAILSSIGRRGRAASPFGAGNAGDVIVDVLTDQDRLEAAKRFSGADRR